jgi:hypothetical protein
MKWFMTDPRRFAWGALFSVFSLFALVRGEWIWLLYLGFLGSLAFLAFPRPADGADRPG